MADEISIRIEDGGVRRMLGKAAATLEDNRPIMGLIGEIVHESIIRNFEEGGRPEKWPELSAATIKQRRKIKKWPGKILIRRGAGGGLMGSIDYRPQKDKVTFGANKKYATTMHYGAEAGSFGTFKVVVRAHERGVKGGRVVRVRAHERRQKLPWGNIEARPYMMVQGGDWTEIKRRVGEYIEAAAQ